MGLGIGPVRGQTEFGDDHQHARDARAMGASPWRGHTLTHAQGLTHQSLHTWSFCTVSPVPGTWPPLSAHQSGHFQGLPQLSGLEMRVGVVSRSPRSPSVTEWEWS